MKKMAVYTIPLTIILTGCLGSGLSQDDQISTVVANTQIAQTSVAHTVEAALGEEPTAQPSQTHVSGGDVMPPEQVEATNTAFAQITIEDSTRVTFEAGGTRADYTNQVAAGQADEYIVQASAGQILQVNISPPNGSVYIDIRGEDGTNLIPSGSQWTSFWSSLGDTQDYIIKVISKGDAQSYSINIMVPAMIVFGTGETSQTIDGHVGENSMVDYLIYAGDGGQEMHVSVTTPGVQVALSITGMYDGQPYLRYVSEETDWTFTLPTAQYYKISVVTIGPATDFTFYIDFD